MAWKERQEYFLSPMTKSLHRLSNLLRLRIVSKSLLRLLSPLMEMDRHRK